MPDFSAKNNNVLTVFFLLLRSCVCLKEVPRIMDKGEIFRKHGGWSVLPLSSRAQTEDRVGELGYCAC